MIITQTVSRIFFVKGMWAGMIEWTLKGLNSQVADIVGHSTYGITKIKNIWYLSRSESQITFHSQRVENVSISFEYS